MAEGLEMSADCEEVRCAVAAEAMAGKCVGPCCSTGQQIMYGMVAML